MVENATHVTFEQCALRGVEGNGITLSRYVRHATITRCSFNNIGATPVVLVGVTELMDGAPGLQPVHNEVSHNHMHHFGVWNRQASGYFEGVARANNVRPWSNAIG